jgi:hypothetical protein
MSDLDFVSPNSILLHLKKLPIQLNRVANRRDEVVKEGLRSGQPFSVANGFNSLCDRLPVSEVKAWVWDRGMW